DREVERGGDGGAERGLSRSRERPGPRGRRVATGPAEHAEGGGEGGRVAARRRGGGALHLRTEGRAVGEGEGDEAEDRTAPVHVAHVAEQLDRHRRAVDGRVPHEL